MSNRNDQQLTLDSLQMAITHRDPKEKLIHHTDRGRLYAAEKYRALMKQYYIIPAWEERVIVMTMRYRKPSLVP